MRCEIRSLFPWQLLAWSAFSAAVLVNESGLAQARYKTAQEAYNAAAKLHNARQYAESRAPLEAAFELSQDNQFKVRVCRALMDCYRQLEPIDKMLEAVDFILQHSERDTEKSLTARSLVSFVHQRGKTADAVSRYEKMLKEDPSSRPALYALTEIYHRAEPNSARRTQLLAALAEVQKQDERRLAEKFEGQAAAEPSLAAAHWKDAALAWLRAGEQQQARAAAKRAEACGPDPRGDLLAHYWHKGMGDIYMALEEPKQAIAHFEQAIQKTNIEGSIKACQEQLAKARAAAGL